MNFEPDFFIPGLRAAALPQNGFWPMPRLACAAGPRPARRNVQPEGRFVTQLSDSRRTRRDLAWSIAAGGSAIVGFAALLALTWYTAETLLLLFAGVLFGVFLSALTDLLGRVVSGYHTLRLTLVCALLTVVMTGVMVLGGATIAQQATLLNSQIRSQLGTVKNFLEQRGIDTSFLEAATVTVTPSASQPAEPRNNLPSAGAIASGTTAIITQTTRILMGVFGGVANFFIVLVLGVCFAAQPSVYRDGVLGFVPRRYLAKTSRILDDTGETLRRWLLGQIGTMTVIFLIVWIGLEIIGIPGALALGLISGLLSFIPTVGAVIAGVVIVLASLGSGWVAAASAFGLYLFMQFLEGNILTPLIQRRAISIPPATIFAAQIFLGVLFGLWGLGLALPLLAIAKVLLTHLKEDNNLGPPATTAPS